MSRREQIVDAFDELANAIGAFSSRTRVAGDWLGPACGKIVNELCAYAGALDRGDLSTDEIRRIGETATETVPGAFRDFGTSLAARLFDDGTDHRKKPT